MYIRYLIFSCTFLKSLLTPSLFQSMWLSGIIATLNITGGNVPPYNIPHRIFTSVKNFPPSDNSTRQFSMVFSIQFITLSVISYILRKSIIQLCLPVSCLGAVEYTDCFSADDYYPHPTSDQFVTLNNLTVILQ